MIFYVAEMHANKNMTLTEVLRK